LGTGHGQALCAQVSRLKSDPVTDFTHFACLDPKGSGV